MNWARMALRLGEPLLPLGRRVPFAVQRLVLEKAMARLFAAPLAEGAFDLLDGRWLRLEISDLDMAWCLTSDGKGLRVASRAPVDVCIRGNWREFLLLASRQEDPDTLFFRRRLVIEGDTDLGLAVKNLLDGLDPEDLPPRLWQVVQGLGAAVRG
ncbi:ubiquinone anaerobic biosynthesis accessory factor UbiT [Zestomonas carbonaria]|uniref:Ubiquinone biosynthesis accessory factor UbiT n=1 Tax=Zestomonas carbonaria TaxID=2762745 RepID=A0A7U7ESX0_9GAMM|nr:SCP2 sterol-binding domain-containing protein [Pseudomonas carbonaria]CAD5110582.1 Ubiquinone biosynthesis accessory factor UbiJ [Pseudomonas carbonaria]